MTVELALFIPWSLLLLGAYLKLSRGVERPPFRSHRKDLALLFALALFVRLVPNFLLTNGARFDVESYQIVANLISKGEDVYSSPLVYGRHPYLPFQMYWLASAHWLSWVSGVSFVKIVRLAPILADALISVLLYLGVGQLTDSVTSSWRAGLLYAFNPIPIFVSACHGQFDAIPLLFALLAWYAWLIRDRKPRWIGRSAFWLGLAILDKSWPILFLPVMLVRLAKWRSRLLYGAIAGLVSAVAVLFYMLIFRGDPIALLRTAAGYNHGVGIWGYTIFVREWSRSMLPGQSAFKWVVQYGRYITLAFLAGVFTFKARKQLPHQAFLTIIVTFYAVTHAFSIQYLMWVVPLALLVQDHRNLERYTLAAYAYMLVAYVGLILDYRWASIMRLPIADRFVIIPTSLPAWLITVHWASYRILEREAQ